MSQKEGYVYILTNRTRSVLYTGVTSDLLYRIYKHRIGKGGAFSKKYKTRHIIYYETYKSIQKAIEREKQLKNWKRKWKLELIKRVNPTMRDIWPDVIREFRQKNR